MLVLSTWRPSTGLVVALIIVGRVFVVNNPFWSGYDGFRFNQDRDENSNHEPAAIKYVDSRYHIEQRSGDGHYNISNSAQLFISKHSKLDKRAPPIPNDTPNLIAARCKGEAAVARMNAPGLAKHTVTIIKDLENSGWLIIDGGIQESPDPLDRPFPNYRSGAHLYAIENFKTYKDSTWTLREPTEGHFNSIFQPKYGFIVAVNNDSPIHKLREESSEPINELRKRLPIYSRWSDIVWIQWTNYCQAAGYNPAALHWIIRDCINTPATKSVMEQVIDPHMSSGQLNAPWPGRVFRPGQDGFIALMGTDHGNGISWLLHDHRNVIKTKVTTITVFREGICYYLRFDLG